MKAQLRSPRRRTTRRLDLRARSGEALVGALLLSLWASLASGQTPEQATLQTGDTPDPQTTTPAATFGDSLTVRVIDVDVLVTNRSGKPVASLQRADFELRVDGQPVPISNFYTSGSGPLGDRPPIEITTTAKGDSTPTSQQVVEPSGSRRSHVVILVDHTRLRASNRKRAFAALEGAIGRLNDRDLVAVVGIEGRLVFYSDFLFDKQGVRRILAQMKQVSKRTEINDFERRQLLGELARGQSGGILGRTNLSDGPAILSRIQAYATEEYARSLSSLRQIETVASSMAGVPGRKLLFYVGEGVPTRPGEGLYVEWRNRFGQDNSSAEIGLRGYNFNTDYTREVGRYDLTQPMRSLATSVNRAGVTLYSVDAESSHGGDTRSALTEQGATSETVSVIDENYRGPLEYASKATGGRLLQSSGMLEKQLSEVVDGLQMYYSLGFSPPEDWDAGSDHKIEVNVRGKGLLVNHRELLRLPDPDELAASTTVAALMYQTLDNPLGISAAPGSPATPRDDGETTVLPVIVEIPIAGLGFVSQDATQAASLTIYVATKDAAGNPGRVQKIPFHLAIPDERMAEALTDKAHYPLPLVLRRGDQQVAIAVRDNVDNVFSAIRLDVSQFSGF